MYLVPLEAPKLALVIFTCICSSRELQKYWIYSNQLKTNMNKSMSIKGPLTVLLLVIWVFEWITESALVDIICSAVPSTLKTSKFAQGWQFILYHGWKFLDKWVDGPWVEIVLSPAACKVSLEGIRLKGGTTEWDSTLLCSAGGVNISNKSQNVVNKKLDLSSHVLFPY